ncbi:apolipoprotein N-acyltransferase [Sphaerochaeta globosa]|uniref:Apolipoprotein N-acyltransferase n=1 Tax=Sphaerochaeta globosa (strain ATCC BAA-1886 / DSM 22777 / Buddy) TaxID=158189 RepID=F0RS01_SPHGB|nr:apolipoprotein N-acyltransferase [Sphaerochaeta globosa]ADY14606.1 Apolipoprotein N-acyltransferase [Sphaerochaeta globosa str. Buddy]
MIDLNPKRNLRTVCSEVLVLLAAAFLYSFAFPGLVSANGLGFIGFFALVPVFAVIRNTTWKLTPVYGFFYGFVFYLFFNYWLKTFHPLAILIVPIIKGGEMVVLFPALKAAQKLFKKYGYVVEGIIWVAYSYISQDWFAGYPYGTLGTAAYQYLPFIQIAEFTGIWGVTLLMVLPQTFLAFILLETMRNRLESFSAYCRQHLIFLVSYAIVLVATLIYGFASISYWRAQEPEKTWKVATIQHSADTWKGGYTTYKNNFNNLRRMSLEALQSDPDIILWSETAFVPSVAWHENYPSDPATSALVEEFVAFGKSLPIPLVTGNPEGVIDDAGQSALLSDGSWNRKDFNTVIFFEDGEIKNTYRKQHLVPFTEHFPYEKELPLLYNLLLANDYNWWEKGYESVVFETEEGVKFSTPICFEDVFGYLNARFVANGADVIVNMTNDGWSKAVSAEMQHLGLAVFRSIENRRTTVRGTNSGMTCVIDVTGKIIEPMEPFKVGWRIYDVPVFTGEVHGTTFYTRHIDWFAFLAIYLSYLLLGLGALNHLIHFIRERRQKRT